MRNGEGEEEDKEDKEVVGWDAGFIQANGGRRRGGDLRLMGL